MESENRNLNRTSKTEAILKIAGEKRQVTYEGMAVRVSWLFYTESRRPGHGRIILSKKAEKRTVNLELYSHEVIFQE